MAGADLVEITSQYAKVGIMQGHAKKASVGLLIATKALNQAFGPLFKFTLKMSAGMKGLVGVFKKSQKGTQDNAKAMKGMADSAEAVDGLFKSIKLSMLMTIGGIFAIIAAFGYLTGAFGQFAYEGLGAGDIFGKLKDVIKGVVDFIKGIGERVSPVFMEIGENVMLLAGIILGMDWSPITDMLMLAFGAIGMLIAEFAVAAIGFFGELFGIFTTLMTYLADTGALQQIIDIVGIVGTTVILVIGSIFAALDMLGINFGSIFGFMTDVIGGFVSFMIDSGLIGFFVDMITVVAMVLSTTALVIAGIILVVADLLSYLTGPTWQIITSVLGGIADSIAGTLAGVLGIVRVVLQLIMLPFRFLFGFITGGWDGAWKAAQKSGDNINKIMRSTADAIWKRFKSLVGNLASAVQGGFQLMLAPIRYVVDKVKELIGYFTDLLDIDLGGVTDMLGDLPGAGLIGDAASWLGFATGGVSRGPRSGYTAVLHGTEAVVPLPDGQSIPVDFRGTVEVQQEGGSGMRELNRTMRRMFTPIANIPQSIKGLFDRPISATLEGEPIAHDIDIKVEHDGESERILTTISGNIERLVKLMAEVPQIITGVVDDKPVPVLDSWMRDLEVEVTHEPIEIEPIKHEIEVKVDHEPIDPIEVKVDHEPIEIDIDVKVEHEEIARQPIVELSRQLGGVLDRYQDLEVDVTYEPIKHEVDVRVEHDPIEHEIDVRVEHEPIEIEVSQPPITINAIPAIKQLIKQLIKPIITIPQIIGRLFEGRIIPVVVKGGIDPPELNLLPAVRAIDNLSGPINSIPQALASVFRQLIKPIIAIPQMIRGLFEGRIIPVAVKSGVELPKIDLFPAIRAIDNLSGPINSIPQALASVFYGRVIPVSINDDITIGRLLDGRTIPVSIQNSGEANLGENVTFNINVSSGSDAAKIAQTVTREIQRAFRTRARSGGFGRGI